MTGVRATEVAYVAFSVPDLARARAFLLDFGLLDAGMAEGALYMTGHGLEPFLYRAATGAPGFAAMAFTVADRDALERLSAMAGAPVEPVTAPGGGYRVRLTDPDGFAIDAVADRQTRPARAQADGAPWNTASSRRRLSAVKRLEAAPAHVERLGHVVLGVADFVRSEAWYKAHFGLLTSDEIVTEEGARMGAFLRLDLGDEPTDHHSLFLAETAGRPGFRHAAFEVRDMDDLMVGHDHLKARGREAAWGIGRHILGSQVFDYWLDPWGHMLEHWTDGDLLIARDRPNIAGKRDLHDVQWGPDFPAEVFARTAEAQA
jgi:catechol 2,3-dioxygenase-like lactoylglutathione lyase family enzyme